MLQIKDQLQRNIKYSWFLYFDRMYTEDHFVKNRIKKFPTVQKLQWFIYDICLFYTESNLPWNVY